ncbi:uncharacterized protein ACIBXB_008985 [Morphnus guianensis]
MERPHGAGYLGITGCRGCCLAPVAEKVSTPGPRLRSSSSTSPVIPSTTLPQENMQFLKWFKYCNLENLHVVLAKQTLSAPERLHPAPAPQQAPALPACAGRSRMPLAFTDKNNDTCAEEDLTVGFSAANSPPSLRAKPPTSTPRVPVSVRRLSSFSAAWHKGVLSVPGEGRARRLSWPCRYFASQGVKELNFSDGKRTEDQTSSLVTSRCWDSSNSPAQARQFHPSAGRGRRGAAAGGSASHPRETPSPAAAGLCSLLSRHLSREQRGVRRKDFLSSGAAACDHVWPRPSQQQIGVPKPFTTRWVSHAIAILLATLLFSLSFLSGKYHIWMQLSSMFIWDEIIHATVKVQYSSDRETCTRPRKI